MAVTVQDRYRTALDLPPPYTLVTLRERGDAHAHAAAIAAESGAGTLVWVRRFDLAEFAVVLEPEEPLVSARRAFIAGMAALADAISAHAPPEKPVTIGYPDLLMFDGARLGGGRLWWPPGTAEDEVPAQLVFSAMVITASVGAHEPGLTPDVTSLAEEGFETLDAAAFVESFARHLMVHMHVWGEDGFRKVADPYLARIPKAKAGARRGIDGNGDLLVELAAGQERTSLVAGLEAASWFDPAAGGPKL